MSLIQTLGISAAGMRAQSERMKVLSQNLANAESTGTSPGAAPYRRQVVVFGEVFDKAIGTETVQVKQVLEDPSDLERKYDPAHPAADETGYVLYPNVQPLIEMMDTREAQRSFEANLTMRETAYSMIQRTLDILRA